MHDFNFYLDLLLLLLYLYSFQDFVVDYFTYRLQLAGFEWSDRAPLPAENLVEYGAMRKMALIFEKKYGKEMKKMVEEISNEKKLTFERYIEVCVTHLYL